MEGPTSGLPLLLLGDGVTTAEDLLVDGDRVLVGEYSTGRVVVLGGPAGRAELPGSIPEVEGLARLGGVLYVAGQRDDDVVALADDGSQRRVIQLAPVSGLEGVDGIATDGRDLIVPDAARGQVLWVGPDGTVKRRVGGFARPTGAWPVENGAVLVADENGGRVYSVPASGAATVIASGLPLVDDVARAPDGRTYAISIGGHSLVEISGGTASVLVGNVSQPQGLGVDGAGNPLLTDYDRGQVFAAVTSFRLLPPAPGARLAPGGSLCVRIARAPGFEGEVSITPGPGYRVARDIGTGVEGAVVPTPGCSAPCVVRVEASAGSRRDAAWLPFAA